LALYSHLSGQGTHLFKECPQLMWETYAKLVRLKELIMAAKKNFPLRIDPKLYEALERWAADELRSVNAHIEFLLRDATRRAGRLPSRPPEEQREDN